MEDKKQNVFSRKKKILLLTSIVISSILMIIFLISVLKPFNSILVYIIMGIYIASVIFEFVMCIIFFKYFIGRYSDKRVL